MFLVERVLFECLSKHQAVNAHDEEACETYDFEREIFSTHSYSFLN